jgi:predicted nucleic acid-binding Zn ribbon protein
MSGPPERPCVTAGVTDRPACAACGRPLPGARADARHCSAACRQRAYRARRASRAGPARTAGAPAPIIYECPACQGRLVGGRRCPECNLFCRRLGPGGECPHCAEPVAMDELVDGAA